MQDEQAALQIFPVRGLPEILPGADLASLIAESFSLRDGDVVVVTQKIVSKAENRFVAVDHNDPVAKRAIAESEAVRVLRRRGEMVITETRHGFICANSGVDLSNVEDGYALLLPVDPDRSARRLRDGLRGNFGVNVGVIISDTFGRVWRRGLTDVAIGTAGIAAVVDLRGQVDSMGRELLVTEICVADEITGAADLVMGKADGVPVAVVRGIESSWLRESSVKDEIVRPPNEDLFR